MTRGKFHSGKGLTQQAQVAQGAPGRLRPRIFLTLGTTRVAGRQPYAPAAFTPGEFPFHNEDLQISGGTIQHTHNPSVSLLCHFHSMSSIYNTEVHLPVIKVPNRSSPQLQDKDVQKCYGLCANYSARGTSGCPKVV